MSQSRTASQPQSQPPHPDTAKPAQPGGGAGLTPVRLDAMSGEPAPGLVRELWDFLKTNKKWWLLPILIMLGLLGILIALAGTGAAPFIYTLY